MPRSIKRKKISVQSAKAKGRKLQQWVRDEVLRLFPSLTKDDVWSRGMGQNGTDVQLSAAAMEKFPYSVECKAQEKFKGLYDVYDQAVENSEGKLEPVAFIKMSRKEPLVLISANHFFELINDNLRSD